MEIVQVQIQLLGVIIDEPVTMVTDLIVSTICFVAFYKLYSAPSQRLKKYFVLYFLLMGIATLLGGIIGHGFLYLFNNSISSPNWLYDFTDKLGFIHTNRTVNVWKLPGWIVSMFSIMFVERASIEFLKGHISDRLSKAFRIVNIIELSTFVTLTLLSLNFKFVEIHSGYGLMFVVMSLHLYSYLKIKTYASLHFLVGVMFAAFAAIIFMNQISIHSWFNYMDISHVLMAVAALKFYKGAKLVLYQ